MKIITSLIILFSVYLYSHEYHNSEHDIKPPKGLKTIGDSHGDIAVDSKGQIYVSVSGGTKAGIQIYDSKGHYLKNLPNAPKDLHGFIIKKEKDGEFLYGTRMIGMSIIKMDIEGKILLTIPGNSIPDKYKNKRRKKQPLRLTNVAVSSNGDLYAVDGYGLDYIHRFDKTGKYIATYGGKAAPYKLSNCHKIAIDTRFGDEIILCCDRRNNRLIHISLEGKVLGEFCKDLRRPSAIAFFGDYVAVAEIYGRVSIIDKTGKIVKVISQNDKEKGGNKWPQSGWKKGLVNSPHGICYDKDGNILVSEYNKFGRIHRFDKTKK